MTISPTHRTGRLTAFASLTILALLAQGCTRDPNVRKVKYLNSGKAYAAQGKEKEAIIQFSNAIKIDPHYADAHFELAKAYMKTGVPLGAYSELMRTVQYDPKNVHARLDLGELLMAGHQPARALEQAKAVLAIDPKNADAWGMESAVALSTGDRAEAMKDIQQALAIEPNRSGLHAQLGLIQASDPSQSQDAEQQIREAVKLDPKNAQAHLLLSGILNKKGDAAGAEAEAQAATQADPKNIHAWVSLTALYLQNGDKAKAESTVLQATDVLHDTNEGAGLAYSFYRQTGQPDRAPAVYANLVSKYPKSVPVKLTYAQVLSDKGDMAKVQQVIDDLNKTNGADPQVEALTGMLMLRNGKVNDAVTALDKGVKNNPDSIQLKFWLGEALKAKGDLPGAEQNFRAVTQAQPSNLLAQKELAAIAAQSHDNALLEQVSQTLVTRFPNLPDGYTWRAITEMSQKQPEQAEADIETALKKDPKNSTALLMLGEVRMEQKKYPEGTQLLQQAIDADPRQIPALELLVRYYMFQHQPDKAMALVQQQIARMPNNGSLYEMLSSLQLATKDVNGALSSADKAMQLNPSDTGAVMAYTRATTAAGNTGAAVAKWQTWVNAHPNDARGYVMLGTLQESAGNPAGAADSYKKAIAIQPDQPVAQNNLANLMLQNGQDVDVALTLAESARRTLPNSPNTADTLAWAYYHKGIYGSARDLLEDAAKTAPNDANIQYHLGMVYSKMGNKASASDHLKKAVSLAPGTQTGNDANKALSSLS